jgi:hypothetical protein
LEEWPGGGGHYVVFCSILSLRRGASVLVVGLDCLEIGFKVFEEKSRRKAEVEIAYQITPVH